MKPIALWFILSKAEYRNHQHTDYFPLWLRVWRVFANKKKLNDR